MPAGSRRAASDPTGSWTALPQKLGCRMTKRAEGAGEVTERQFEKDMGMVLVAANGLPSVNV